MTTAFIVLATVAGGVLIAAAFLADPVLGWTTAAAVLLHEVPQELGDFAVLIAAGLTRRRALLLNSLSGLAMVAGGVLGYLVLEGARAALPAVIALAAASFIYIAAADLVPHLQRERSRSAAPIQAALIAAGALAVSIGHWIPH